jgi:hypothetical protein
MPITGFEGAYYMVLKGLLEGLELPIREIGKVYWRVWEGILKGL